MEHANTNLLFSQNETRFNANAPIVFNQYASRREQLNLELVDAAKRRDYRNMATLIRLGAVFEEKHSFRLNLLEPAQHP